MATLSSTITGSGFHFTLSTTFGLDDSVDLVDQQLHIVYDLDPHVYADQYELAQRPGYSTVLWGTTDLEKPVSAVDSDGSVLLLTADTSRLVSHPPANITFEVPLHARYGNPLAGVASDSAYHRIVLRRPLGFLAAKGDVRACSKQIPVAREVPEPLRPYASLDGWPSSRLSLIRDTAADEPLNVVIPVGVLDDLTWVDLGTATVVITMFFYLLHASWKTARRLSSKLSTKTD
ncbi:hypothetical protein OH77DRAFT_1530344 [Trametes cingulata]|nr:hypothetical protein OH77DRAFT_1530344 [Trametes cingulata]